MPERNLIQRPDLINRMRQFLGIRQKSVIPTLATTLQPVIVIGNLDEPIRTLEGRRAGYVQGQVTSVAGQNGGIAISVPGQAPFIKAYLRRARLTANIAGITVSDAWHPVSPSTQGVLTDWGTGGDTGTVPRTRTGVASDNNAAGFATGAFSGIPVPQSPDFVDIDLSGFVLTAQNVTPALAGGNGQGYWFIMDQVAAGQLLTGFFWFEEEVAPARGSN